MATTDGRSVAGSRGNGAVGSNGLSGSVERAVGRTQQWLLEQQADDGHWCAELEGDSILESEYILLLAFLGMEQSDRAQKAARYLVETQLPDGGWAMYPGGKVEISGSVKAYFALKLTGHDPDAEYMRRARKAVLEHGGADRVNSFTRFYLALLGQISYELCPAVPPEMVLLPKWAPVDIHTMSSWSRTIFVPLSIVSAQQPVRAIEPQHGIRELFVREPNDWPALRRPGSPQREPWIGWSRFFRTMDALLRWSRRHRIVPFRRRAVAQAHRWMLDRFERSDGLGAIFPPIVWSVVALRSLGYAMDSDEVRRCCEELDRLVLEDEATKTVRLQPCKSPVWDTALTLRALQASGVPADSPAIGKSIRWLLDRQIRQPGDWQQTVAAEPGGWCFEYQNDFYPDTDDTSMVLMALKDWHDQRRGKNGDAATVDETAAAIERGERWLVAMQNRDGGWGAFDRNNNLELLCQVPFADHNAMIDPSTPDLSGRVVECLSLLGRRRSDSVMHRAVAYLRGSQESDGSWYGRWGVNYIYGTWQTLTGMAASGAGNDDRAIGNGAAWLRRYQQPCGGWGESADSYEDASLRGQGAPTPSQTAWALMGLLAAGAKDEPAVERAVRYLVETQREDGTWEETEVTGTGFPCVFYLRYHYYRIYFPLMALGRWAATGRAG